MCRSLAGLDGKLIGATLHEGRVVEAPDATELWREGSHVKELTIVLEGSARVSIGREV